MSANACKLVQAVCNKAVLRAVGRDQAPHLSDVKWGFFFAQKEEGGRQDREERLEGREIKRADDLLHLQKLSYKNF